MAHSAPSIYEVRKDTGSDTNGGGFAAFATGAGTDYSQQDSPQYTINGGSVTAVVHTTTTQINITGYTVSLNDRRNMLNITAGTATAGVYEITAVDTVNNRYTLDRAAGTAGQTITTGKIGGAWASTAMLINSTNSLSSNAIVHIKTGASAYTTGVAITGGSTGRKIYGYTTTRGDGGRAQINPTVNLSGILLDWAEVQNIEIDDNATTLTLGIRATALCDNCIVTGAVTGISSFTASSLIRNSRAVDCTTTGFQVGGMASRCIADNTNVGFTFSGGRTEECIAIDCSGSGFNGSTAATFIFVKRCAAIRCGIGFSMTAANVGGCFVDCLAVDAGTHGFAGPGTASAAQGVLDNCWSYSPGTGDSTGFFQKGAVGSLSNDPFNDYAGDDFSLNNVSGGGASLRGTTWEFIGLATTQSFSHAGAIEPDNTGEIGIPTEGQCWPAAPYLNY